MKLANLLPGLVAACLSASLLLGGCGGDQAAPFALPTPTRGTPGAAPSAPGGGTINLTLNRDPDVLNPVLATTGAAAAVNRMLYPSLLGRNPYTGQLGSDNAMAATWEVAPDGLTYTFTLRPNITWSDGDPLDAADFKFTYDAILSDQVESPLKAALENLAGIELLDPLRVQVRFRQALCDGLDVLRIGWLPSHLYAPDFTDVMTSRENANPTVSGGPYILQSWAPNENIVMRRNQRYWQGVPAADRLVFHIERDATERFARLLDGRVDVSPVLAAQMTSAEADPNLTVYSANQDGYDFIALNLANPENPQPGLDDAGNRVVQDPHPVLADPSVRRAIAQAIDYETVIESIYLSRGYRIASNVLPIIPWAYDVTVEPYSYDPNAARQLLEGAGWLDTNNDGIRERGTTALILGLLVVEGNTAHEQLAELVQDQLNSIGFDITIATVDAAALAAQLLGQRYDMAITGWTDLGADPNDDWLWTPEHDRPGSDFNFVSYQNAEVEQLLRQANTVAGCRPEDRAPLYKQIQRLIHDDVPYVFISGAVGDVAFRNELAGVQPASWDIYWNIHQWFKTASQP